MVVNSGLYRIATPLPCVRSWDVCCQFIAPNPEPDIVGATCYKIQYYSGVKSRVKA